MTRTHSSKVSVYLGGLLTALLLTACSASPPGITSVATSKDAEGKTPAASFGQKDTIYAKALVKSGPSKIKLTWQLFAEKAEGVSDNFHIPPADVTQEFTTDATSDYKVSAPPNDGWPAGTYRLETTIADESGKQLEQKKTTFTIAAAS